MLKIDAISQANLVNKWLVRTKTDFYTPENQKVPYKTKYHWDIQWPEIKRYFKWSLEKPERVGWALRYGLALAGLILYVKKIIPVPIFMWPIAFDAATGTNNYGIGETSFTLSHTAGGSDRAVIAGVSIREDGSNRTITGVDYGATAMSSVGSVANGTGGNSSLWKLSAPATGAQTVTFTVSTGGAEFKTGGVISFTGANQTTANLTGTYASATGTSTAPSVDVSSATDEIVVDCVNGVTGGDADATVGAGQTQRVQQWSTINDSGVQADRRVCGLMSTEAGGTTVTMAWTLATSRDWATSGAGVKPVAVAVGGATLFGLMGIGN